MSSTRLFLLTLLAMLFFAGNSVLCRLAFTQNSIDAASFTTIRLLSGTLMLILLTHLRCRTTTIAFNNADNRHGIGGNWLSASTLFVYAASFSFAYVNLPAGIGALLLFGAVQATMILAGLWTGENLSARQISGLLIAMAGLVAMLLPGISAPSTISALLMVSAGIAWGIYSLRGRSVTDPSGETAGNFLRAAACSMLLSVILLAHTHFDGRGISYAILSGAITSGIGYTIWYAALRRLPAIHAASVQLSVPVIAALGGMLFLHELITLRLLITSAAILGGITLVIFNKPSAYAKIPA